MRIVKIVLLVVAALVAFQLLLILFTDGADADSCDPNYVPAEEGGSICGEGTAYIEPVPDVTYDGERYPGLSGAVDVAVGQSVDEVSEYGGRWVKRTRETSLNIRWPGGTIHFSTSRRWKIDGHQVVEAEPTQMDCWVTGYTGGWRCDGFNRRWDRKWFAWDGWWLGGYSQKSSYRVQQCNTIDPAPGDICFRTRYHDVKLISHAHRPLARIRVLP